MTLRHVLLLFFVASILGDGQTPCVLDQAHTGDFIKLRGVVQHGAHDVLIVPEGCPDQEVIVDWGKRVSATRDEKFKEFERYLSEQQPEKPNTLCIGCYRWEVTAELTGRLDIAPAAGLITDSKTGKRSIQGFGHPLPFSRYQLTLTTAVVVSKKRVR